MRMITRDYFISVKPEMISEPAWVVEAVAVAFFCGVRGIGSVAAAEYNSSSDSEDEMSRS